MRRPLVASPARLWSEHGIEGRFVSSIVASDDSFSAAGRRVPPSLPQHQAQVWIRVRYLLSTVDVRQKTLEVTIGGMQLNAKLPDDGREIRYLGYDVKDTSSEFTPWEVA